mmetsp:Transcript_15948/g.18328  ORF Transcript_15948/g.18328 Transcript_15948/m.18328 type:complete len:325 (-) Transcript_15948:231-1205(-)
MRMDTTLIIENEGATTPKYRVIKEIGAGIKTKVFLAESVVDCKRYAVKLVAEGDTRESIEESILSRLDHESVIQWKESVQLEDLTFFCKEDQEVCKELKLSRGFVMEYAAKGDCIELIQKLKMLPEPVARSYAQQLLNVIEHLHSNQIAHRDIKLDNIFLDEQYCLKLGDFGASQVFPQGEMINLTVGTERYFAPEILLETEYDPFIADVFAMGVSIFELVCGYSPYVEASLNDELYSLIVEENWEEFWSIHKEIQPSSPVVTRASLRSYFEAVLCPDPERRIPISEIKNLEWAKIPTMDKTKVASWVIEIAKKQKVDLMVSSC